jgi:hypothetical protein
VCNRYGSRRAERLSLGKRSDERFGEHLDGCDDILKGLPRVGKLGLPDESPPVNLLDPVLYERRIEDRGRDGDRRISVLERFSTASASTSPPLKSNARNSIQMS